MQPHVDFITALTSEPQIDFVNALSAEQGCDVCHELHASVDEMRCGVCEAAICPDCARLRPDTMLACLPCYERHPVRVFRSGGGPRSRQQALEHIRESADALRDSLTQIARRVRAGEGALANVRLSLLALIVTLADRLLRGARSSSAYLRSLELPVRARRVYRRSSELGARAYAEGAVASRRAYAISRGYSRLGYAHSRVFYQSASATGIELSKQGLWAARKHGAVALAFSQRTTVRLRDSVIRAWITLRNMPVRSHAISLLLTVLILYAVARADHREG